MNKTKKEVQTVQLSDEQTALLSPENSGRLNQLFELFSHFETKSDGELKNLTSEYLELKENSKYDLIFTGMTTFKTVNDDGEETERSAAQLVDRSGKQYINGGAVLVNACRKIEKVPAFIRITTGQKVNSSNGGGKYLQMDVRTI